MAVQTLTYPSARPTGVQNLVKGSYIPIAPIPCNTFTTGTGAVLVGDIIVDSGAFGGNGVPGNITGNAAPGTTVAANFSGNGVPATALRLTAATQVLATTGNAGNAATGASNLQQLVHDCFMGVSCSYRDYTQTTTGTIRDYLSVATEGVAVFTLVGNSASAPGTLGNGTTLDGIGIGSGNNGFVNNTCTAIPGMLVAVATYPVNGTNAGNNSAIVVDANSLPCVEILPVANIGNLGTCAIGVVDRPVLSTDTQVYVRFRATIIGGVGNVTV